jgi:hypothetical protein
MSEIITVDIDAHTGVAPVTLHYSTQGYVTPFPRTNVIKWSEQFNNALWTKTRSSVTTDSTTAPDGTATAEKLVEDTNTGGHYTTQNPTLADNTVYCYSVHAKAAERTSVAVGITTKAASSRIVQFNLTTGAISSVGGASGLPTFSGVEVLPDGWFRCWVAHDVGVGAGTFIPRAFISNGVTATYTGDGSSGLYVWGAQLEVGTAPSAYIPTTTAAVTVPDAGQENLYYEGRVKQPGNIQRAIFDRGATFGASRVGYGEVVLVNNDGALDGFLGYGFAGFGITIQRGTIAPNQSTPTWTTVLQGTMDSVDFSWSEVSIKVRDRQQELTKPIQATRYGGTNSLPNGLDGVATDIKGNGRPILFGRVYNITPPQVNTTRRIFELSDGVVQSVDAVYDRGTALTAGTAYSSQADMETNAPSAGQYRAWLNAAGSYIRLGSEPAGAVTVDATQGATVATRTAAQLMSQVLLKGGISSGDITAADVTALDTAAVYECGYWVADGKDATGVQVMDALANSAGAWWGVDRLGKFRMGQLAEPVTGNSIGTLTALDIIKVDRVRSTDQGGGVPAWQVTLNYARMFTVQPDLAAAVPTALKSDRAEQWRTVLANDASVKTQWPKAVEVTFDTHLVSSSDAATEATRRLGLYMVRRDTLQARCKLSDDLAASIDLGKTITVQLSRFGMSAGKAYLVTGIRTDLRNNTFDLTLWG